MLDFKRLLRPICWLKGHVEASSGHRVYCDRCDQTLGYDTFREGRVLTHGIYPIGDAVCRRQGHDYSYAETAHLASCRCGRRQGIIDLDGGKRHKRECLDGHEWRTVHFGHVDPVDYEKCRYCDVTRPKVAA